MKYHSAELKGASPDPEAKPEFRAYGFEVLVLLIYWVLNYQFLHIQ